MCSTQTAWQYCCVKFGLGWKGNQGSPHFFSTTPCSCSTPCINTWPQSGEGFANRASWENLFRDRRRVSPNNIGNNRLGGDERRNGNTFLCENATMSLTTPTVAPSSNTLLLAHYSHITGHTRKSTLDSCVEGAWHRAAIFSRNSVPESAGVTLAVEQMTSTSSKLQIFW